MVSDHSQYTNLSYFYSRGYVSDMNPFRRSGIREDVEALSNFLAVGGLERFVVQIKVMAARY